MLLAELKEIHEIPPLERHCLEQCPSSTKTVTAQNALSSVCASIKKQVNEHIE